MGSVRMSMVFNVSPYAAMSVLRLFLASRPSTSLCRARLSACVYIVTLGIIPGMGRAPTVFLFSCGVLTAATRGVWCLDTGTCSSLWPGTQLWGGSFGLTGKEDGVSGHLEMCRLPAPPTRCIYLHNGSSFVVVSGSPMFGDSVPESGEISAGADKEWVMTRYGVVADHYLYWQNHSHPPGTCQWQRVSQVHPPKPIRSLQSRTWCPLLNHCTGWGGAPPHPWLGSHLLAKCKYQLRPVPL